MPGRAAGSRHARPSARPKVSSTKPDVWHVNSPPPWVYCTPFSPTGEERGNKYHSHSVRVSVVLCPFAAAAWQAWECHTSVCALTTHVTLLRLFCFLCTVDAGPSFWRSWLFWRPRWPITRWLPHGPLRRLPLCSLSPAFLQPNHGPTSDPKPTVCRAPHPHHFSFTPCSESSVSLHRASRWWWRECAFYVTPHACSWLQFSTVPPHLCDDDTPKNR